MIALKTVTSGPQLSRLLHEPELRTIRQGNH